MSQMKLFAKKYGLIIGILAIGMLVVALILPKASVIDLGMNQEYYSVNFNTDPSPDSMDEIVVIQVSPSVKSQTIYTDDSSMTLNVDLRFGNLNWDNGIAVKYKTAETYGSWNIYSDDHPDIDSNHRYVGESGFLTISKTATANARIWEFMILIWSDSNSEPKVHHSDRLDIIIIFTQIPELKTTTIPTTTTEEPTTVETTVVNGTTVTVTGNGDNGNGISGFGLLVTVVVIPLVVLNRKRGRDD